MCAECRGDGQSVDAQSSRRAGGQIANREAEGQAAAWLPGIPAASCPPLPLPSCWRMTPAAAPRPAAHIEQKAAEGGWKPGGDAAGSWLISAAKCRVRLRYKAGMTSVATQRCTHPALTWICPSFSMSLRKAASWLRTSRTLAASCRATRSSWASCCCAALSSAAATNRGDCSRRAARGGGGEGGNAGKQGGSEVMPGGSPSNCFQLFIVGNQSTPACQLPAHSPTHLELQAHAFRPRPAAIAAAAATGADGVAAAGETFKNELLKGLEPAALPGWVGGQLRCLGPAQRAGAAAAVAEHCQLGLQRGARAAAAAATAGYRGALGKDHLLAVQHMLTQSQMSRAVGCWPPTPAQHSTAQHGAVPCNPPPDGQHLWLVNTQHPRRVAANKGHNLFHLLR